MIAIFVSTNSFANKNLTVGKLLRYVKFYIAPLCSEIPEQISYRQPLADALSCQAIKPRASQL